MSFDLTGLSCSPSFAYSFNLHFFVCQSFCIIRVGPGFQGGHGVGVESYKEEFPYSGVRDGLDLRAPQTSN